jgi:SOS-response transcriptional repressor LexA
MKELTSQQHKILQFIRQAIEETGFPPTRAEIARALSFRSPNAAENKPSQRFVKEERLSPRPLAAFHANHNHARTKIDGRERPYPATRRTDRS